MAAGALMIWLSLVKGSWRGAEVIQERGMDFGIAAFLISALISAVFSIDPIMSLLGPHQGQFHALLPLLLYALIFYGVTYARCPQEGVSFMILLASVGISAWGVVQGLGLDPWFFWSIQDGRVGSTLGSPIHIGAFLTIVLPLGWHWSYKGGWMSKLGAVATFLALTAMLCARSRGGFASGISGIIIYEMLRREKKVAAVVAVMGLLAMSGMFHGHSASDLSRIETWRIALSIWKANPILGSGPDTFGLGMRHFMTQRFIDVYGNAHSFQLAAHNDVLQVLSTMGLLGLACYAIFLFCAVRVARGACRYSDEAKAISAALFALFVQAKVNPIHIAVLGIAAAMLASLEHHDDFPLPRRSNHGALTLLASAACAMLLAWGCWMCLAERFQRIGETYRAIGKSCADSGNVKCANAAYIEMAENFNRAAIVNRWDYYYTQNQLDYLYNVHALLPNAQLQFTLVVAEMLAARGVRLHPNDPMAHEAWASAILFQAQARGRPQRYADIDRELIAAQELAPLFPNFPQKRAALPGLMRRR